MSPTRHKPPVHHTPTSKAHKPKPRHKPRHHPPPKVGIAAVTLRGRGTPGHLRGGHRVLIQALTRPTQISALLGPNGARITGGYGNWEAVAVPRWIPLTQWTGRSLWTMDLDLLLDGWGRQRSVEADVRNVELFALYQGKQPLHRQVETPPPIRIFGAVPHPELRWVVTGIDWGDALRDFHTGARLRQGLTLHLMEFREETAMVADLRGRAAPTAPRKYKVKHGDDLKKIATRMLRKSSRWPEIVKLNKGLRGWKLSAKWVGKTIRVPAK